MSNFSLRKSRDYLPGLGTIIWIASIIGVIVGFIVYDMNRNESCIRRLIEAGRRRVDGVDEIEEAADEADETTEEGVEGDAA